MASVSTWLAASRPKTLPAAAAPVFMGTAIGWDEGVAHLLSAALCCISAICIQIGTNFYNDVADFEKGSDTPDRLGPVRATASGLVTPGAMKRATAAAFAAAVLAGGYLMVRGGWPIVLVGVLSITFGILYTAGRKSLAGLGIADIFVFIFFGPVAVVGTYYVQALHLNGLVFIAGLAPGALSVAILLVNNIRDRDEDARSGKRTLVVRLGHDWGVRLYGLCILIAAVVPVWLLALRPDKMAVLLPLAVLPISISILLRLRTDVPDADLNPLLVRTAQVLFVYSVLFCIGWLA